MAEVDPNIALLGELARVGAPWHLCLPELRRLSATMTTEQIQLAVMDYAGRAGAVHPALTYPLGEWMAVILESIVRMFPQPPQVRQLGLTYSSPSGRILRALEALLAELRRTGHYADSAQVSEQLLLLLGGRTTFPISDDSRRELAEQVAKTPIIFWLKKGLASDYRMMGQFAKANQLWRELRAEYGAAGSPKPPLVLADRPALRLYQQAEACQLDAPSNADSLLRQARKMVEEVFVGLLHEGTPVQQPMQSDPLMKIGVPFMDMGRIVDFYLFRRDYEQARIWRMLAQVLPSAARYEQIYEQRRDLIVDVALKPGTPHEQQLLSWLEHVKEEAQPHPFLGQKREDSFVEVALLDCAFVFQSQHQPARAQEYYQQWTSLPRWWPLRILTGYAHRMEEKIIESTRIFVAGSDLARRLSNPIFGFASLPLFADSNQLSATYIDMLDGQQRLDKLEMDFTDVLAWFTLRTEVFKRCGRQADADASRKLLLAFAQRGIQEGYVFPDELETL